MNAVLQQFLTESFEGLERMTDLLLQLERSPGDSARLHDLFRVVHTLKGNSGLFDFPALTRVVHAGEDLLDLAREGELMLEAPHIEDLLALVDLLSAMLEQVECEESTGQVLDEQALQLAQKLRAHQPAHGPGPVSDTWLASRPTASDQEQAELTEACRQLHAQGLEPLQQLVYQPESDCFFKGEAFAAAA